MTFASLLDTIHSGGTSDAPLLSPGVQHDGHSLDTEPVRGRSISRGSSSSSLYERAVASGAVQDPNRARSTSGHSISPVASYSPPYTSSLHNLGAGTAVMHSEPSNRTGRSQMQRSIGGGGSNSRIQVARPVSGGRRHAILQGESSDEDSSSQAGSSTEHEEQDDEEAADMDLQNEAASHQASKDGASFSSRMGARQSAPSSANSQTLKQAHRTAFDEDDRNEILESVDRDGEDEEEGFDERPASGAADAGRSGDSVRLNRGGKGAKKAASQPHRSARSSAAQQQQEQLSQYQRNDSLLTSGTSGNSLQLDGLADDGSTSRLFDSPHLPSSPKFTSAINIPALAHASAPTGEVTSGSISARLDDAVAASSAEKIPWADRPERPSAARKSLLRNLSDRGPQSSRHTSAAQSSRMGRSASLGSSRSPDRDDNDSDELSDPASNGYSYGFDLSDEDEGKGIVGRAVDLVGALWTVGRGMVWNKPETPPATPSGTSETKR